MIYMKSQIFVLLAAVIAVQLIAAPPAPTPDSGPLKWDAESKECTPRPGDLSVDFTFCATNTSGTEVSINALRPSCGCTTAQLPATPYKLAPGSNVTISVSMNLAGKMGRVTKSVTVDSSAGLKSLLVTANIPTETKTESR